jgi:hypothetical protein
MSMNIISVNIITIASSGITRIPTPKPIIYINIINNLSIVIYQFKYYICFLHFLHVIHQIWPQMESYDFHISLINYIHWIPNKLQIIFNILSNKYFSKQAGYLAG